MDFNVVNKFSYNNYKPITFNKNHRVSNVSFTSHADFYKLKDAYEVTASSYFRRGPYYGGASDKFSEIVDVFKQIFQGASEKKSMFICGIADSQEPFSDLAVIREIIQPKRLEDVLDLKINDLQSCPRRWKLFEDSFYGTKFSMPEFAQSSFVTDDNYNYRVNNEIFKFLFETYSSHRQSKWEKPIQKAIKEYPNAAFDIVSINNTLGYLAAVTENWKPLMNMTLQEIYRTLKSGGVFITDPGSSNRLVEANLSENFSEIYDGIFMKIK